MSRWITALMLTGALWGCEEGQPAESPDAYGGGGAGGVGRGVDMTVRSPESGRPDGAVDSGVEAPLVSREIGRMTIEQLARSIPIVTEGLRWTDDFGDGEVDLLALLAATLGAPDYVNVTDENLEPTLIIAKFMQDASNAICGRWVARDQGAATRSLVQHEGAWSARDEADVRVAIQRLQLRFYARQVALDSTRVDRLHTLFVNASSTAQAGRETADGWLAVCIALMTDPEFILY